MSGYINVRPFSILSHAWYGWGKISKKFHFECDLKSATCIFTLKEKIFKKAPKMGRFLKKFHIQLASKVKFFLQSSFFFFTHSAPFWLVLCFNWTCMKYIWVNRHPKVSPATYHNFSLLLWQLNSCAQRHQWLLAISRFEIIFSQEKIFEKKFYMKIYSCLRDGFRFPVILRSYGLE